MSAHQPAPIEVLSQGRAAVYEEPSGPAGVRVRELPRTDPKPGHVAVAPPRIIAADGAGVVHASADPAWKPGDEVVIYPVACCWECSWCLAGENVRCARFGVIGEHTDGTACELVHVDARNVFAKPDGLTWEEAGAFPLTFLTAWRMLNTRARLLPDETVLVVGAGAGVAVAAIAIARHIGARVFATSRSEAKRARAMELGAEATFDSSGFGAAVREVTGDGVDVVFEHVGPATLSESMRSLALGGRIVTCGSTSGVKAEISMPRLFFGHVSLLGSTMGNASEFEAVLRAIDRGLRPVVDRVYPLDDVQSALEHLDAAEQFGKVVLSIS
ncbi:MAG: zinc-binding dehydrogenase [Chloroflexi bacterium]|nr:MAG: zinc-binding dehydrogenase [Chloroflexota bacterium]